MSGAEVFAVAGGIAAFATLLENAKDIVSWIRSGPSGEQLSMETNEVQLRFELLAELQKLNVNLEAPQSKALREVMEKVSCQLHDLQNMTSFEESFKGAKKRDRARQAFKQPARTKKLRDCLLSLERSLKLVYEFLHTRSRSQISLTSEPALSGSPAPTEMVVDAGLHTEVATSSLCTQPSGSELIGFQPSLGYFRSSHGSHCSYGTCVCLCHHTTRDIYHHSQVEGSSWASLFIKCSCSAKAFSWTITAFQRQVSLMVSLAYEQSFSLSPSLRICNTVPNTSPLFVVLYKCSIGCMQFDKALSDIQSILSFGGGSLYDINRDGDNWFEELLHYPWDFPYRHTQFALLDHFMSEGVTIKSEKLLLRAIRWIGEGPHMELLETILPRNGSRPLMDPMKAHAVLFRKWPATFSPGWRSRSLTRDPFFIEALSLFVNHDPDFGDTGPLQYQIHSGSLDSIRDLLSRGDFTCLTKEKNFLQQSVLHISVNKPKILRLLLSHGFADIVDAGDRDGTTALMYAAAYGETSSAIELLGAGAKPWLLSDRKELYLDHALERGHFHLIEDIVNFHIAEGDPAIAQLTLDAALHRYVWRNITFTDSFLAGLRRLLELGARPKWVTDKGNTLFHAISTVDKASLLLEFSSPNNSQNAIGHTPLMVLSWLLDVDLVRKLLSVSVPIHERDRSGWTVFEHLFRANSLGCRGSYCLLHYEVMKWVPTFQIAFDLLQAGADFGSSDCCTCHCSSQGCTALRFFLPSIHSQKGRRHNLCWIPWIIELFLLLRGLHKGGLQILIKSLIRRQRFDEIGLTHTCCLTLEGLSVSRYASPYTSAMEEERSEDDHRPVINADHKELRELQEEQQELVDELENYCQVFAEKKELAPTDCESTLVKTLARRVVFVERGSAQVASRANSRRHLALQKSCQSSPKWYSDKIEILSPPPNEHVIDYGKDQFSANIHCSIQWDYYSIPCIEDLVDDYLHSTKTLDYHGFPLLENHKNHGLHHERQRLCQMLMQEIRAVRGMRDEEADWTQDIVAEDS